MIDFVVTWVDGTDPAWIKQYNKYVTDDKKIDVANIRYRDNGLFKYWFRCVDKNAPWVNKVHLVTNGQIPNWINTNCKKLNLVKHSDYIPEEYLPVFNSHPIENIMYKIPNLSEKFVYFNDDFFIVNPVSEEDFFTSDGIIKDFACLYNLPMSRFGLILLNNEIALRKKYSITDAIKLNKKLWFSNIDIKNSCITKLLYRWRSSACIRWSHFGQPYTKQLFHDCWKEYYEDFERTMHSKFRCDTDINHYLVREYALLKGMFSVTPVFKVNKYMDLTDPIEEICKNIISKKYKQLVINDQDVSDSDNRYNKIRDAFESKFPCKSQFEI